VRARRPAGYSAQEIATLLEVPAARVESWIEAGFVEDRDRLDFRDLVLLRAARGLTEGGVGPRRVRKALRRLREVLPRGRHLASVRISADGARVVVRDSGTAWDAESGQTLLDFEVRDLARAAAPFADRRARAMRSADGPATAAEWFHWGEELEPTSPAEARDAYRRALELEPDLAEAHLNLGRLLHEQRDFEAAERQYLAARRLRPDDPTASFNLGVLREDRGQLDGAIAAYRATVELEPSFADAHFNLAGLYERKGAKAAALGHLKTYKRLIGR
jgi:tetratricopeptide (TPR) repeat protein